MEKATQLIESLRALVAAHGIVPDIDLKPDLLHHLVEAGVRTLALLAWL